MAQSGSILMKDLRTLVSLVEERIRQAEATIESRQAVKGIEEMPAEAAAAVLDQKADAVSPVSVSWDVSCKHKHKHSTSTKQLWRRRAQDEAFRRGPERGPLGGTRSQGPGPKRGEGQRAAAARRACPGGRMRRRQVGDQLSWLECGIEEPMQASLTSSELAQRR